MVSRLLYRSFSAKINYYEVLGILPSARPEEVKLAYRKLVKELHPDVAISHNSEAKFRLVTEAYSVLSKLETRATYDLTHGSKQEIESILEKKRDKDGLDVAKIKYAPHQYGYKRMKELAEERKLYNIDNFYRYRGGLPQKHLRNVRGNAYGAPGTKADAYELNFILKGHNQISRESDYVDDTEAHEFKLSRAMDSDSLMRTKPFLRADIDYNFTKMLTFKRHLLFYLAVFGVLVTSKFIYAFPKLRIKQIIKEIQEKANTRGHKYEKAGMRAVSLK